MYGESNYLGNMFGNLPESNDGEMVPLKDAETAPGRRPDPPRPPPSVQTEQHMNEAHQKYLAHRMNAATPQANQELTKKWGQYLQNSFNILDLVEEEEEMSKAAFPSPEVKNRVINSIKAELEKSQNALVDCEAEFSKLQANPACVQASKCLAEIFFIRENPDHAKIEGKFTTILSFPQFVKTPQVSQPAHPHQPVHPHQPAHPAQPVRPTGPDRQALSILHNAGLPQTQHMGAIDERPNGFRGFFDDPLGWFTGSTLGKIVGVGALAGTAYVAYNHMNQNSDDLEPFDPEDDDEIDTF